VQTLIPIQLTWAVSPPVGCQPVIIYTRLPSPFINITQPEG